MPGGDRFVRLTVAFAAVLTALLGLGLEFGPILKGPLPARPAGSPPSDVHQTAQGRCPTDPLAPAKTPTVELETRPGDNGTARYGALQYPRSPLRPKDIALTIDDGPDAAHHEEVLAILDRHCLKAAFFFVGFYAEARPDLVRETAARGHILATHSWTHPNNLRKLGPAGAKSQIERGFWAVQSAMEPAPLPDKARLAPFFRFPGLNDSPTLLAYLGQRNIAAVSADFGADDWKRRIDVDGVKERALYEAAQTNGGILILHETKAHTVAALSDLITEFERRGYRFVLIVPKPGARAWAGAGEDPLLTPLPAPTPKGTKLSPKV